MTILKISYRDDESDPYDNMSDEEQEIQRVLQMDQMEREVRAGEKADFVPQQHPRYPAGTPGGVGGQFVPATDGGAATSTPSSADEFLPRDEEEVMGAFSAGAEEYLMKLSQHGGPTGDDLPSVDEIYDMMSVGAAAPEGVTEEERARCEKATAEFLTDPDMKRFFNEYGTPHIVVASRLIGEGAGDDPTDGGVLAQWSNGTIFLYGSTVGEPEFGRQAPPGWSVGDSLGPTATRDTLMHEYGHQVMGVVGYAADSSASDTRVSFIGAMMETDVSDLSKLSAADKSRAEGNVDANGAQISEYATASPDEGWAECFALVNQEGFDINDYYGGARDALEVVIARLDADVPGWRVDPNQTQLEGMGR